MHPLQEPAFQEPAFQPSALHKNDQLALSPPQHWEIPETFASDWHPQHGASLAVFPRYIPGRSSGEIEALWPDLSTLIEDDSTRQMMYFPISPSRLSVQIIFNKVRERRHGSERALGDCGGSYSIIQYDDAEAVHHWQSDALDAALFHAIWED